MSIYCHKENRERDRNSNEKRQKTIFKVQKKGTDSMREWIKQQQSKEKKEKKTTCKVRYKHWKDWNK